MSDIEFVPGLIVKQRASNAPDYVICKLSIKPQELAEWLQGKAGEWVNIDVKVSKSGKPYAAVDSWKPEAQSRQPAPSRPPARAPAPQRPQAAPAPAPRQSSGFDDMDDDIPFN
jgi:single-stranded DNA-binding protein